MAAPIDVNTVYSWDEIKKHTTRDNGVWIVIKGLVYNVTAFMLEHPGGDERLTPVLCFNDYVCKDDILLQAAGTDATADFEEVGHSLEAKPHMEKCLIGKVAQ